MTSRISIARPQGASGGYQPDPHGFGNSRNSTGYRAANPDDPLEKVRVAARQIEDNVDIWTQPLKPYLPAIARFLIVVTFLEDSLRIVTQWSDQLWYLQRCVHALHLQSVLLITQCVPLQAPSLPVGNLTSLPTYQRFGTFASKRFGRV